MDPAEVAEGSLVVIPPSAAPHVFSCGAPVTVTGGSQGLLCYHGESPETQARVATDGDCLRLRADPGLQSRLLNCLPNGTTVTLRPQTATVDGVTWRRVRAGETEGWVAAQYLEP